MTNREGGDILYLHTPFAACDGSYIVTLVGGICKGFFLLRDGEAAGSGLLGECLVEFVVLLLERGGVEAVGEGGRPSYNVRPCGELFNALFEHFGFDAVLDGFGFFLGFLDELFESLEVFDFLNEFVCRHCCPFVCGFVRVSAPFDGSIIARDEREWKIRYFLKDGGG